MNVAERAAGDFAQWIASLVGEPERIEDASWVYGPATVVELHLADGRTAYLKCDSSRRKFLQERAAYDTWCVHLEHTPALLGATEDPRPALLLEGAPGTPLLQQRLDHASERRTYASAGRFLAALHGLPCADTDSMPIPEAWEKRARTWAERASAHIGVDALKKVVDLASAPWVGDVPDRVPCHRDYTGRNWLVEEGSFTVIDFEHARPDWHLVDHERVRSSIPSGRDDLLEAFYDGFGRRLTDEEEGLLSRVRAVSAMSRISWAAEHGDQLFERAGRRSLAELMSAEG